MNLQDGSQNNNLWNMNVYSNEEEEEEEDDDDEEDKKKK